MDSLHRTAYAASSTFVGAIAAARLARSQPRFTANALVTGDLSVQPGF
jgi:hypothetical protein